MHGYFHGQFNGMEKLLGKATLKNYFKKTWARSIRNASYLKIPYKEKRFPKIQIVKSLKFVNSLILNQY